MRVIELIVITRHDWLDYVIAGTGLVGGVAAVGALVLATLSKRDAARSADAAEQTRELADEQVAIMRSEAAAAEAERDRRAAPEIELGYRAFGTSDTAPPGLIVLTAGFSNENGTRAVERLAVNLRVPNHLEMRTCEDEYGNGTGAAAIRELPDVELGDHRGVLVWFATIGPIDRRVFAVRYLKLGRPVPGRHRIEADLAHPDLPGGESHHAWLLTVPEAGDRIEYEPVHVGEPVTTG